MKFVKIKLLLAASAMFAGYAACNAQQVTTLGPEWGENASAEERHDNALRFNFYRDAYNTKRYDDALKYLPDLLEKSPRGAQNIYVYAINIYKNKIQRSMDPTQRGVYVDSLLTLYDLRMEYFGDNARYGRPYILVQKAKDYLNFKAMDRDGVRETFVEAIKANSDTPEVDFINLYFNELTTDYKNDLVETDYYMEQYEWLSELLDKISDAEALEAKNTFDAIFVSSNAADCENLERIFSARLAASPDNADLLGKAFALLMRSECYTPFLEKVGRDLYKSAPTAQNARSVANVFVKTGNTSEALTFLKAAFDKESDPVQKSLLAVEISGTELTLKNASAAASYANQARNLDPENGYAYIMLAQAYAEGSSACEGFDRQTVYWLAYDILSSARNLFPAGSDEIAQINQTMSLFRRSFPSRDDLFFRGLTSEGAAYDVKCGWISGRTSVKFVD